MDMFFGLWVWDVLPKWFNYLRWEPIFISDPGTITMLSYLILFIKGCCTIWATFQDIRLGYVNKASNTPIHIQTGISWVYLLFTSWFFSSYHECTMNPQIRSFHLFFQCICSYLSKIALRMKEKNEGCCLQSSIFSWLLHFVLYYISFSLRLR